MRPSEVEDFIKYWKIGEEKGFKYLDPNLFGIEWVVVVKETDNLYRVIEARSSTGGGPWKLEAIEKLLGSDKLIFHSGLSDLDYRFKKSDGCQCGSWVFGNTYPHSYWCPRWRK